jgi:hypothetical protein
VTMAVSMVESMSGHFGRQPPPTLLLALPR